MTFEMYATAGAAVIILLLFYWIIRLEIKLRKLLGKKENTLDDALSSLRKDNDGLKKFALQSQKNFEVIDKKLAKTISGTETVRFNPFKGTGSGGNQSFATAFVNKDGDGVVISSLYSRDHVSVFSKPIKKLSSEYDLTAEEKSALQKAKESII